MGFEYWWEIRSYKHIRLITDMLYDRKIINFKETVQKINLVFFISETLTCRQNNLTLWSMGTQTPRENWFNLLENNSLTKYTANLNVSHITYNK
jgi:hypothetical protein